MWFDEGERREKREDRREKEGRGLRKEERVERGTVILTLFDHFNYINHGRG